MKKRLIDEGQIAVKRAKHGIFAFNKNDAFVGKSLDLYGEWCEPELTLLDKFIFPGDIVLDIGAYIGTHSIFFAKKVAPTGFVFSFEPQRLVFNLLSANIALNNLPNIKALQVVLSDKKGVLKVPVLDPTKEQNFGALRLEEFVEGEPVESLMVDSLLFNKVNLMKIDVEGMEKRVLDGARQTIRDKRPIIYVENNREDKSENLISSLLNLDYNLWWHILDYFNPNNYFKNKENVFENFYPEANMLALPKERKIRVKGLDKVKGGKDTWRKAAARALKGNY